MGSSIRFGASPWSFASPTPRKGTPQLEASGSNTTSTSTSPTSQPITPPERTMSMSPLSLLYYFARPFTSPSLIAEKPAVPVAIAEDELLPPPQLSPEETAKLGKDFLNAIRKFSPPNEIPVTKQADPEDFAELKAILRQGLSVNYQEGRSKRTAVMLAAENGHLPLVKFLVEQQGANIKLTDRDGFNALHYGIGGAYDVKEGEENPHNQVAQFLLAKGIDFKSQGGFLKDTPLGIAARRGNIPLLKMLLAKYMEEGGKSAKLAALSQTNRNGDTPLHNAAGNHQLEAARILLEEDADVDAANARDGNRPAHRAAIVADKEMLILLYDHKAKMHLPNNAGEIPQDVARDPAIARLGFMFPKIKVAPPTWALPPQHESGSSD